MKLVRQKNIDSIGKKFKDPEADFYKLVYVTVILFFTGTFVCVTYGFKTIIPIKDIIVLVVSCALAGIAFHQFFFKSAFPMKQMERVMLSIFGLAPVLAALFMVFNYFIILEASTSNYVVYEISHYGDKVSFKTDQLPCEDYPEFCNSSDDDIQDMGRGDTMAITIGRGIFGYRVLKKVKHASVTGSSSGL